MNTEDFIKGKVEEFNKQFIGIGEDNKEEFRFNYLHHEQIATPDKVRKFIESALREAVGERDREIKARIETVMPKREPLTEAEEKDRYTRNPQLSYCQGINDTLLSVRDAIDKVFSSPDKKV